MLDSDPTIPYKFKLPNGRTSLWYILFLLSTPSLLILSCFIMRKKLEFLTIDEVVYFNPTCIRSDKRENDGLYIIQCLSIEYQHKLAQVKIKWLRFLWKILLRSSYFTEDITYKGLWSSFNNIFKKVCLLEFKK